MSKKILAVLLAVIMAFGVFTVLPASAEEAQTSLKATDEKLLYGDADNNSDVNIKDSTVIQKYNANLVDTVDEKLSDVNADGEVNVKDAVFIQKYVNKDLRNFSTAYDSDWRTSSIGYEIFVRSFCDSNGDGCGDFMGVANKVDYLKSLNVGVVWLMPFNKTGSYHGYDVDDYMEVCEDYGTLEDFKKMVEILHENGIKVLMDLVVNHTSKDNQWFKNSVNGVGDYKDFYNWKDSATLQEQNSHWNYNSTNKKYYYYCFSWGMPDLNYKNKNVWTAVENVAGYWLDNGVDGFRLDGAMHIDDSITSGGNHIDEGEDSVTHEWWQHFEKYVKAKNPDAMCIGEVWPETSMQTTQQKFFGDLDSVFDFYDMSEIKSMAKGSSKQIARVMNAYNEKCYEYADKTPDVSKVTINSVMLDNHDVNRIAYDYKNDSKASARLNDRLKLAASVQMTVGGMPWIYYGNEIGQSGGGTNGSYDYYRREPMDWYKGVSGEGATRVNALRNWGNGVYAKYTLSNDGVSVEEQDGVEGSLLEHYRKLTNIRNKYPIFYTGKYTNSLFAGSLVGYSVTDETRDYSMFVIHNNRTVAEKFVAQCDFTEELSGVSYKTGDTVTLNDLTSFIIKYTDTLPLAVAE